MKAYGAWISPNGIVYPVRQYAGHLDKAMEIVGPCNDPDVILFLRGWMRIVYNPDGTIDTAEHLPDVPTLQKRFWDSAQRKSIYEPD